MKTFAKTIAATFVALLISGQAFAADDHMRDSSILPDHSSVITDNEFDYSSSQNTWQNDAYFGN
jgi:hypothetical protein